VVLRFGKYLETTEPGPRWHIPWPVENVEVVNVSQIFTIEVGYRNSVKTKVLDEALMLTDDENIVDLQFAVQYIRSIPEDYLFFDRNPDLTVMQVAESTIREIVGKSKMDFVLYEGREQIASDAKILMQTILDRYKTGITISQVTMQNAQPPEQVQAAFDDAVKANQDRERQINEGQAYYNDVVPKAEGTAARLVQQAEGYSERVVAAAEGETSRFLQVLREYKKAPVATRERLYVDTLQSVLKNSSKLLIDQKNNSNLLFLPLDKILDSVKSDSSNYLNSNNLSSNNNLRNDNSGSMDFKKSFERARDNFNNRNRDSR
jgi:membrane protease subunit HflK